MSGQWPVGGMSVLDLAAFLAFFAARFSFKLRICFFRFSLWTVLLAMATFRLSRTYPSVAAGDGGWCVPRFDETRCAA